MIKYAVEVSIRFFLRAFHLLPLKKQILFESFQGSNLNCNPLYVYRKFREENPDVKIIWTYNAEAPQDKEFENVRFVKFHSIKWLMANLFSKVIVNNDSFALFIPYRKKQLLINTWHGGGAYKKIGNADNALADSKEEQKKNAYFAKITDYFVSSSTIFSQTASASFGFSERQMLESGMPRNDIFFDKEKISEANKKVRTFYHIDDDRLLILFAPTFRGDARNSQFENQLDFTQLRTALSKKFKKDVTLMFRGHHTMKNSIGTDEGADFDASHYPDMQELLCAADVLVTDYSSSMWDFSFTEKPCFLFMPDLEFYIQDRGFYTEPQTWGFPIATSNQELSKRISEFSIRKYKQDLKKNHEFFGSMEDGKATEKICEIIRKKFQ